MANTLYVAPTANYVSTTLNGAITDSAATITLNSTANLQAPGYVVIDRVDSNGNSTPNAREVVAYTGVSGNDLTGCSRGADGSTNRAHSNGAIVETMPTVGMWNSLSTIVASGLDSNGYLRAIASPVSIARGQFTQIVVPSVASLARAEIAFLENKQAAVTSVASIAEAKITRAFLAGVTITTSINAANASIVGFNAAVLRSQSLATALISIGSTNTFTDFMVHTVPNTFATAFGKITFHGSLNPGSSSTNPWQILVNGVPIYSTKFVWPSENNFTRPWTMVIGTTLASGATVRVQTKTNDSIASVVDDYRLILLEQ
jgi:hypothetical protein